MDFPRWIAHFLKKDDALAIEEKIAELELKTSSEVISMIVKKSSAVSSVGRYCYIILFIIFSFIADDLIVNLILPSTSKSYLFSSFLITNQNLFIFVIYISSLALLFPVSRFFSNLSAVQRFLLHPDDKSAQAHQRAKFEFYEAGLNKTDGSTGVLIFVSLMEHEVIILADKGINQKIDAKEWVQIKDQLIQNIKSRNTAQGFLQCIDRVGDLLNSHFPIKENDVNELENHLIIKE